MNVSPLVPIASMLLRSFPLRLEKSWLGLRLGLGVGVGLANPNPNSNQKIMDQLAWDRANACLQALIKEGVDPKRMWIRAEGRTGYIKVDFIPKAYAQQDPNAATTLLPPGVPFRVLHKRAPNEGKDLREALAQVLP